MIRLAVASILALLTASCLRSDTRPFLAEPGYTPHTEALGPDPEPTGQQHDQAARTPDVEYVPTPQPVVDVMLEVANLEESDIVYDLGCGDGRIVVTAAKRYGTRAFGFDIDPELVAEARRNVRENDVEHLVTIEEKDIFTLDLSPADVVTLYLLPELNVKLIPQLRRLKPGSRIVSHDFDMKPIEPLQAIRIDYDGEDHYVYLWEGPI